MPLDPADLRSPLPPGDPNIPPGEDGTPRLVGSIGPGWLWLVTDNTTGQTISATTDEVRAAIAPQGVGQPLVVFVSPSPAIPATLVAGSNVVLQATATAVSGIGKVEFYEGATFIGLGVLTNGVYQYPYAVPASGTHSLVAKATASSGSTGSAATFFFVGAVQQTTPAPRFFGFVDDVAGGNVQLETAPGVPMADYRYFIGANGVETAVPLSGIISVGNVSGIVYAYSIASATRERSPTAQSPNFTASVQLPVVDFVAPVYFSSVPASTSILLRATATDTSGIAKVEFYEDNTFIGTALLISGIYQLAYVTPASGFAINIEARATAVSGQVGKTTTLAFLALPAGKPNITSFTPTEGIVGATVTVSGTNLGGLTAVTLNGQPTLYTSISSNQFSFVVPTGASSGVISATTPAGVVVSTVPFAVRATAVVPSAPTIGTATAGNGTASITFAAPASNGGALITSYNVYRNGAALPVGTTTALVYNDNSVTNGVSFSYQVSATNAAGEGAKSASSASVTPAAPIITYVAQPQTYATTAADYTAKCGSGTGLTVSRTSTSGSSTVSQAAADAAALADAKAQAIAAIVCPVAAPTFNTTLNPGESVSTVTWNASPGVLLRLNLPLSTSTAPNPATMDVNAPNGTPVGSASYNGADTGTQVAVFYNNVNYYLLLTNGIVTLA